MSRAAPAASPPRSRRRGALADPRARAVFVRGTADSELRAARRCVIIALMFGDRAAPWMLAAGRSRSRVVMRARGWTA